MATTEKITTGQNNMIEDVSLRDRSQFWRGTSGASDASTVPSDEILNDPGWQAFHAFRWVCDFLGHPEPTAPGFETRLEVSRMTPEASEEWQRLSVPERQARLRERLAQLGRDGFGLPPRSAPSA